MRFGKRNTLLVKSVMAYLLGKKGFKYDREYIDKTSKDFIDWYKDLETPKNI